MGLTSSTTHSYKKAERLKNQAGFNFLYEKGKRYDRSLFFGMYSFDYPVKHLTHNLMAAFSAPKKNFKKAVTRNLLKRRMREAWRLNNQSIKKLLPEKERNLVIAVRYKSKLVLDYLTIEKEMRDFIRFLEERV